MGSEDAFFPHRLYIVVIYGLPARLLRLFFEKGKGEEARMTFVHMVPLDTVVAQGFEHSHPAYAEDGLLAEPVLRVASIEVIGERSI